MPSNDVRRLFNVFISFGLLIVSRSLAVFFFSVLSLPQPYLSICAMLAGFGIAILTIKYLTRNEKEQEKPAVTSVPKSVLYIFQVFAICVILMYLVSLLPIDSESVTIFNPVSLIAGIIIYPIVEEYYFRKLLYLELRPMSRVFGVMVQAVMFAIVHSSVEEMIFALLCGIVLGFAAEKTGRLIITVIIHSIINLRSYIFSLGMLGDKAMLAVDVIIILTGFICSIVIVEMKRTEGKTGVD